MAAKIYLDHAATTPVRPSAIDAWVEVARKLAAEPGNPSAIHAGGRAARRMLEDARARLAAALGADRAEVLFTSGATESAALGVIGAALGKRSSFSEARGGDARAKRIVVSGVEHPAVAKQRDVAQNMGFAWTVLPTSYQGSVVLDPAALDEDTILASLVAVCSETGVIQPVADMVELGATQGFLVHSDATAAVGNLPVRFQNSGLDLMTIGGHKFGAPVGTGALLVKRDVKIRTDRPGGGQERQLRSGTQDVAGAVALAVAAEEAVAQLDSRRSLHTELRGQLVAGLPDGVAVTDVAQAIPSIVHLSLPTRHPEAVLLELDRAGILASAGSACHAGVTRPSSILLEMGRNQDQALGVLRVSFGRDSSSFDVQALLAALPFAVSAGARMDALDVRGRAK